jgi:hypothetical protein
MVIFINLPKHAALPTVKMISKYGFNLWNFIRLAVTMRIANISEDCRQSAESFCRVLSDSQLFKIILTF